VDSAAFAGRGATLCGLEFYPHERVLFASDCPFDPEKGPGYIRETIKILDSLGLAKYKLNDIYYRNFEKLTGHTFGSFPVGPTRRPGKSNRRVLGCFSA
jgi:aminocarboxymuconate-semialdehyde decarboxylase